MSSTLFTSRAIRGKLNNASVKKSIENSKYKNIKPVVDSGASLRKHLEQIAETRKYIKQKRDEIFKRIKLQTFVTLMTEVAKEALETSPDYLIGTFSNDDLGGRITSGGIAKRMLDSAETSRSVVTGYGEILSETDGRNSTSTFCESVGSDAHVCPYLLLDVRDPELYRQCHIVTAKNYPHAMLSRACNYETKDLLAYKNDMSKIIVCYDEDESLASRVVTVLFQRGYDNIFLLSGGLKLAAARFPRGLIVGTLPSSCRPTDPDGRHSRSSAISESSRTCITASLKPPTNCANGECLSQDDINVLEAHLNRLVIHRSPRESSTSRQGNTPVPSSLSHRSSVGSSASASSAGTSAKRKPWK